MPYTSSNTTAPHRKNAALRTRSDSPYQQRTSQKDNPTQQLIKQAVDFLIQQLEAGKSETLTAYLAAMARFHAYSFGNILQIARQRPTATRVAGLRAWNELVRIVELTDAQALETSIVENLQRRDVHRPPCTARRFFKASQFLRLQSKQLKHYLR